MSFSPWLAGALAAAMIGGAATGISLDTTPIERFSNPLETIPRHTAAVHERRAAFAPQPNHYAMDTPQGTLSVSEVVMRRRQLNEPEWYTAHYTPEPYYLDENGRGIELSEAYEHQEQPERERPEAAPVRIAAMQSTQPLAPAGDSPMALPVAQVETTQPAPSISEQSNSSRVIDVQAELALQP